MSPLIEAHVLLDMKRTGNQVFESFSTFLVMCVDVCVCAFSYPFD